MGQHVLQRGVFIQQLQRRFFAHPRDAGDIVAGIAHQAFPVRHLFGGNTEKRLHAGCVKEGAFGDALAGEQHPGAIANKLQSVPVAGENHAIQPVFPAFAGKGAQNVVRLIALHGQNAQMHLRENFPDDAKLGPQLLRGGPAARLVIRISGMAEGGRMLVKGHGNIPRRKLLHRLEQHG